MPERTVPDSRASYRQRRTKLESSTSSAASSVHFHDIGLNFSSNAKAVLPEVNRREYRKPEYTDGRGRQCKGEKYIKLIEKEQEH